MRACINAWSVAAWIPFPHMSLLVLRASTQCKSILLAGECAYECGCYRGDSAYAVEMYGENNRGDGKQGCGGMYVNAVSLLACISPNPLAAQYVYSIAPPITTATSSASQPSYLRGWAAACVPPFYGLPCPRPAYQVALPVPGAPPRTTCSTGHTARAHVLSSTQVCKSCPCL